jgi:hypothetical protein
MAQTLEKILSIPTIDATNVQINYFYNYSQVNPMCHFSHKCV